MIYRLKTLPILKEKWMNMMHWIKNIFVEYLFSKDKLNTLYKSNKAQDRD